MPRMLHAAAAEERRRLTGEGTSAGWRGESAEAAAPAVFDAIKANPAA